MSNNVKIVFFSIVFGMFWSSPALRALTTNSATSLEVWLSVLIRILIVYGVLKFVLSLVKKTSK
jgi:hypothetical protein